MNRKDVISKEELYQKYVVGKYSAKDIAILKEVDRSLISRRLREWNIPIRKGHPTTEETRRKISERLKGKSLSEETRRKMSEARKGREGHPHTKETKRKMSEALKGIKRHPHTEEARKKMSEAAKKRLENPEERRRLSDAAKKNPPRYWLGKLRSEESKRKISEGNKGKTRSEEARRKISIASKNYWEKFSLEERREKTKKAVLASQETNPSSLELTIQKLLKSLKIEFEPQKSIGPYVVDIYIPSKNLILECDGNYWHHLPGRENHDRKRDIWFRKKGYSILRLWESEIKKITPLKLVNSLNNIK